MIIRQPGVTKAGMRSKQMVSNLDIFATILDHTNTPQANRNLPSRSLKSVMVGSDQADWGPDVVFSEQEETRVVRTPKWAFFKRFEGGKQRFEDELFDVENDPGETQNLVSDPAFADVVADLKTQLAGFFDAHTIDDADLWKGGCPIQHSERIQYWRDVWGDEWAPVYAYKDS